MASLLFPAEFSASESIENAGFKRDTEECLDCRDNLKSLMEKYEMKPHPEGGFYVETFRSPHKTIGNDGKERSTMTSIIYLLSNKDYSTFHRILGDELWYHHNGNDMEIHMLNPNNGEYNVEICGNSKQAKLQIIVPGGVWFAAKPIPSENFDHSCCACVVSPGFDFADFEIARRDDLLNNFANHKEIVTKLTKL